MKKTKDEYLDGIVSCLKKKQDYDTSQERVSNIIQEAKLWYDVLAKVYHTAEAGIALKEIKRPNDVEDLSGIVDSIDDWANRESTIFLTLMEPQVLDADLALRKYKRASTVPIVRSYQDYSLSSMGSYLNERNLYYYFRAAASEKIFNKGVQVLEGTDIIGAYGKESVKDERGLHSCMSSNPQGMLSMYANSPEKVKLVVYCDPNGKFQVPTLRALMWQIGDNQWYLDRAYSSGYRPLRHLVYRNILLGNPTLLGDKEYNIVDMAVTNGYGAESIKRQPYTVDLNYAPTIPYMDSFAYFVGASQRHNKLRLKNYSKAMRDVFTKSDKLQVDRASFKRALAGYTCNAASESGIPTSRSGRSGKDLRLGSHAIPVNGHDRFVDSDGGYINIQESIVGTFKTLEEFLLGDDYWHLSCLVVRINKLYDDEFTGKSYTLVDNCYHQFSKNISATVKFNESAFIHKSDLIEYNSHFYDSSDFVKLTSKFYDGDMAPKKETVEVFGTTGDKVPHYMLKSDCIPNWNLEAGLGGIHKSLKDSLVPHWLTTSSIFPMELFDYTFHNKDGKLVGAFNCESYVKGNLLPKKKTPAQKSRTKSKFNLMKQFGFSQVQLAHKIYKKSNIVATIANESINIISSFPVSIKVLEQDGDVVDGVDIEALYQEELSRIDVGIKALMKVDAIELSEGDSLAEERKPNQIRFSFNGKTKLLQY